MKKNLLFIFCFFTFGLAAQIPSYIPTNCLVGWWPFNGNANDESGNGNHGTVNGATLSADRNGIENKAYSFDGASNYINVNPSTSLNTNNMSKLSISGWFNFSSNTQSGFIVRFGNPDVTTGGIGYEIYIYNSKLYVSNWNKNTFPIYEANSTVQNNQWIFFAIVYDFANNTSSFYINGLLISTINASLYKSINPYLNIGRNTNGGTYFNGKIDDICIWNRDLTQQEITALYTSCTTLPSATITPQSSTNFCQGNSVVLNASTGTNYTYEWYKDGTIINGATTSSFSALTAGSYTVKVIDGSCNATSSATTLTLIDTLIWTGNVDNDWHKPCNWSPAVVPECCNSVKIPFTSNSPVVSGVAKAKNVNVYSTSGATLTVNNGANLQIETCPVNKTENSCPTLPVLTTTIISNTTQTTAESGGNITYAGSSTITARGVCWSTTTAPTIANSKTTDGSGTGSFTSNLTGLIAGTTYYLRAYATNASGTSYGNEVSFINQPAYAIGSVFCNGTPTYVQDVTNPITGKTWMDRNLGASQIATATNDASAYGDLYQWGRGSDGHQCRNSQVLLYTTSSSDSPGQGLFIATSSNWRYPANNNLWQGANGINNPCPNGYRLPTEIELNSERLTWSNNDLSTAYQSALKFTGGGARNRYDGNIIDIGYGYYWSCNINSTNARYLNIGKNINDASMISYPRATGASIRCIKD